MLAMADQHGRVWASVPGLANRARVPIEDAQKALDAFLSPDPYSRTPDNEGRRIEPIDGGWRLLNHEKYRSIRDEESIKESKRNYINARRAREREDVEKSRTQSNSVDSGRANAEAYTEAEADTENKEVKAPRKRAAPSPAQTKPHDVAEQTWQDWLALRKAKRAPVTATVVEGARREAEKAAMSLEAFLQVWCRRGSQGLEAAWLRPDERGGYAPVNKQQALEQRNREVAAAWLPPELRAQQSGGV